MSEEAAASLRASAKERMAKHQFQKGHKPWNTGKKKTKDPKVRRPVHYDAGAAPDVALPPAAKTAKNAQDLIQVYRAHYGPLAFHELVKMAFWTQVPFRERCTLMLFIAQQWMGKPPTEATAPITFNLNIGRHGEMDDGGPKTVQAGPLTITERV